MLPYFVVFVSSIFFSILSENIRVKKKSGGAFFSLLSILTLSIFAGARDLSIGGDIKTYGIQVFTRRALSINFQEALNNNPGIDSGYVLLNFITSRFTSNMHIFLFILALLTYGITYMSISQLRSSINVSFSIFILCMFLFPISLNILRQGLACAIVTLAISCLVSGKVRTCFVLLVIAPFFHSSSIIGFLIIGIWWLLRTIKTKKIEKVCIGLVFFVFAIVFAINPLISFLIGHGILSSKYNMYFDGSSYGEIVNATTGASLGNFYRIVIILIFLIILYRKKDDNLLIFFFIISSLEFILTIFLKGSAGATVARMGYYFAWFSPICYSIAVRNISAKFARKSINFIIVVIALVVFVHTLQSSPTWDATTGQYYPYTSQILGIE